MLRARGVETGERLLICGPNCPQWVQAYFGCAIAGVVMVPLDIRSAPDFIERVAEATDPVLAFVSRRNPQTFEALGVPLLYFEDLDDLLEKFEPLRPEPPRPVDLLEIMFTSGTTGVPKGVMLTHANLMTNLTGSMRHVPSSPDYRLISLLPLSHMFEQMAGLLLPLSGGANITYPTALQPSALTRAMRERR
jgi:long-chain acyl-CoA synthetase